MCKKLQEKIYIKIWYTFLERNFSTNILPADMPNDKTICDNVVIEDFATCIGIT